MKNRILATASSAWESISEDHRRALFWAFCIAFLGYFIFIAHHLLDNHAFRMPWLAENEQVQNGRWLGPWIGLLHYGANVPVVMQVLSFFFALGSCFLILKTLKLVDHRGDLIIFYSFVTLFPFNLAFFYYTFMVPQFYVGWVFAAAAFAVTSKLSVLRLAIGAIFVLLMMASYQPSLSILATLAVGAVIANLLREGGASQLDAVKYEGLLLGGRALSTLVGGAIYWLTISYLPESSKSVDFSSMSAMFERFQLVIVSSYQHLWLTQPDMQPLTKALTGLILVGAILATIASLYRSPLKLGIALLAWVIMVPATKAIFLISEPGQIFQYRYNSGVIFLYAFAVAVLFFTCRGKIANWLATILIVLTTVQFFQADLVRQVVLLRGQQRDLAVFNRMLYRVESLEEFDKSQTYDFIRIGALPRYRLQLLASRGHATDMIGDGHMDYGEISDLWVDDHVFGLLGSSVRLQTSRRQTAQQIRDEGLLEGRQPWPHESSVFIDNNRIIVYVN